METISGLTNWRLVVRREEGGVTILRAVTCDENAVLPDEIFGLPVTRLSDRALAHGAKPAQGEEVRVLGGAENEDWDNRNIRSLSLPRGLESVGDYAFMNLKSMETLRLYDAVQSIGSASFMNCRLFSRLELTRISHDQGPVLAAIVGSLPQELDAAVYGADGSMVRLIFPEYFENYTENSPAHHFELKIVGGGYAYHGVFRAKKLYLPEYDALWRDYIAAEHDEESALRLAYYRLRYPAELSDRAREQYAAFLRQNMPDALSLAMREKDLSGLRLLLSLGGLDAPTLEAAMNESRALRFTEATALLLEQRRGQAGAGRRKKFEL